MGGRRQRARVRENGVGMAGDEYLHGRVRWHEKPTLMGQRMFHLPVLGWVTVFQFTLLVGAGMPGMFIAVTVADIYAAPWPLLAAFMFAKFRPPLLGYEMRLCYMVRFRMFGPRERKAGPKPKKYAMPRATRGMVEAKPEPDAPLEIVVYDRPRELRMGLPPGTPADRRVEVRMDGAVVGTQHPDSDGTVHLVLYPDDMRGERTITIHDGAGAQLAGRVLVFVQG